MQTHATASGQQTMPLALQKLKEQQQQEEAATSVISRTRLLDLVQEIDGGQALDKDVENALVEIANEFVEKVVSFSCQLAKHRHSDVLEAKDVQLHLERNWNMRIPGFGRDDVRPTRIPKQTDLVKKALAAIQRDSNLHTVKKRRVDFRKDTRPDESSGPGSTPAVGNTPLAPVLDP